MISFSPRTISPEVSKLPLSPNHTTSQLLPKTSPRSVFSSKVSPEPLLSPNSTVFFKDCSLQAARHNKQPSITGSQPLPDIAIEEEEDHHPGLSFLKDDGSKNNLEDGRKSKAEFQKFLLIDMGTALTACIGGLLTIFAYDLEFEERDDALLKGLLVLIFVSTLITIAFDTFAHLQTIQYLKAKNILSEKDNIITSGRIWWLFAEVFLLLLQPYFFARGVQVDASSIIADEQYYYNLNDFFSIMVAFRVLFVARFVLNLTLYRSPRSQRLTAFYGTSNGYIFACRCLMRKKPFTVVLLSLGLSAVVFGYMLRICERPLDRTVDYQKGFSSYWNSMWCTIVSITTVGFGDFYARTIAGRLITFLACIWGAASVSLVIVAMYSMLSIDGGQDKVLTVLERLEKRKQLKEQSAYILTNLARVGLNNRKIKDKVRLEKENKAAIERLKTHLSIFRKIEREIKATIGDPSLIEEMDAQAEFFRDEIKEIKAAQENLVQDIEKVKSLILKFKNRTQMQR